MSCLIFESSLLMTETRLRLFKFCGKHYSDHTSLNQVASGIIMDLHQIKPLV